MDIYDIEIYRSKVGVRFFELIGTTKGLLLPQMNSLVDVFKRLGIEYKVITHDSGLSGNVDISGDNDDDIDNFLDNFIIGTD